MALRSVDMTTGSSNGSHLSTDDLDEAHIADAWRSQEMDAVFIPAVQTLAGVLSPVEMENMILRRWLACCSLRFSGAAGMRFGFQY
jgi:hypothetical protein